MDEKKPDDEFSKWFSTYGLITSQRILGYYAITLPQAELIPAIKNSTSFYHCLVQVPLKNVLNGIILQQANDYHVYIQKLFIDYLLSGESGKSPQEQGASTRESLESERKALVQLGEEFNQKQMDHETVISSTQKALMNITTDLSDSIKNAINTISYFAMQVEANYTSTQIEYSLIHALVYAGKDKANPSINRDLFIDKLDEVLKLNKINEMEAPLEDELSSFFMMLEKAYEQIDELFNRVLSITDSARAFRSQFYQAALRVIELIKLLADYRIDPVQDAINRESLYFDKTIGEN